MAAVPYRFAFPGAIEILDQTLLPFREEYRALRSVADVVEAIQSLRVRGAPFLGLIGAAGMVIAAVERGVEDDALRMAAHELATARPTAVDLSIQVGRALAVALGVHRVERYDALRVFVQREAREREIQDRRMGIAGAAELADVEAVLTHCNTGALATGGIGSALGVIRTAWEAGTLRHCYATETRPLLQGARLTAWELKSLGIPAILLPDTAAASLIASGLVGAVITGADRIARNGDTANKIGTYGLAIAAARHGLPFYVAAPRSTFDDGCADGRGIPIEFRDGSEVGGFGGQRWSPDGIEAYNPAFDVTPGELITAFITEAGVLRPPYEHSIPGFLHEHQYPGTRTL